jgi:hypothetical protein
VRRVAVAVSALIEGEDVDALVEPSVRVLAY